MKQLREMSLQEKVEAAASEADGDPEAAASNLKESMTAKEKRSVWSKHQTWLKGGKSFAKSFKKEKGEAASLWLMQQQGSQYLTCSAKVI